MNKKLVFNITFHHQIEQLKFHLDNLFSWNLSNSNEFVITSAHKENLDKITEYCLKNYPTKKVDFCFIEKDMGYHIGTIVNIIESIKYINDNKDYDYIINVEADNMFYDENKLKYIILKMIEKNKHMLLIHEGDWGYNLINRFQHLNIPNYLHITTLNIYSKYFIQNHFPKKYYEEYMDFGWCGNPGTPFEPYLALSFIKKHNLISDEIQTNYWNKHGLILNYDRNKIIFDGWYQPDNMTPDKFMRWGIVNCPSTAGKIADGWEIVKQFIELHKPLMYNADAE